jgi:hypothetical protein
MAALRKAGVEQSQNFEEKAGVLLPQMQIVEIRPPKSLVLGFRPES